ncbi:MAG: hypothetical protein P8Y97_03190 [Candidatus Lokiarchaeota archaeon]
MSKKIVMNYLKRNPYITKKTLYDQFPQHTHSVIGRFYNEFKTIKFHRKAVKELLLSELQEEKQRFEQFKKILSNYALNNEIHITWKGTFPSLSNLNRKILCRLHLLKVSFSNKDPFHPYFYREIYGLSIWRIKCLEMECIVSAYSCQFNEDNLKLLIPRNQLINVIPINPLKSEDWHLTHLQEVFETLFPLN